MRIETEKPSTAQESFREFAEKVKRKPKNKGISNKQLRARWQQHLATTTANLNTGTHQKLSLVTSNPTFHGQHYSEEQGKLAAYLMSPWGPAMRLPNMANSAYRTALYRSYEEIPVTSYGIVGAPTPDDGKFACLVRPCLGDANNVEAYSNYISSYDSGGWGQWNDPVAWKTSVAADPNVSVLAGLEGLCYSSTTTSGTPDVLTFPFDGMTYTYLPSNYSGAITYGSLSTIGLFGWTLAPGTTWEFAITLQLVGGAYTSLLTPNTEPGINISNLNNIQDATATTNVITGTITNSSSVPAGFALTFTASAGAPPLDRAYASVSFSLCDSTIVSNNGPVSTIRPVAMAAWLEFTSPELTFGGNVSSALLPENALETNWVPTVATNGYGNFEEWENLANIEDHYNGKLVKGSYNYWMPSSPDQYNFETPVDSVDKSYNSIAISGVITDSSGNGVPGIQFGILRVVRVFEFQTNALLFQSDFTTLDIRDLERVNMLMRHIPRSMENSNHKETILKVIRAAISGARKARNFYNEHKAGINALASAVGLLL